MSDVTVTPTAVAHRDEAYLNASISAVATTITVAPFYKWVDGVKTLTGFDSTSGIAEISAGEKWEIISFGDASVHATTKVTTLTDIRRGLPPDTATADYTAGTGMVWAKNAKIRVIQAAQYVQGGMFTDKVNTLTGSGQVTSSSTTVAGIRLNSLTTSERDAIASPANGDLIYNETTGVVNQYIAGSWEAVGTEGVSTATEAAEGKVELATVAEHDPATTGARVIQAKNTVQTSGDASCAEKAVVVLNSSEKVDPSILGSGTPTAATALFGDNSWGSVLTSVGLYGDGSDGTPDWSGGASLDPTGDYSYDTATVTAGQTVTVSSVNAPLVIKTSGDVIINGTVDLDGKGGAGGAGAATGNNTGTAGTNGKNIFGDDCVDGGNGGGGTTEAAGSGGGGGGSQYNDGTAGQQIWGTAGAGGTMTAIFAARLAYSSGAFRCVACGAGGGGGGGGAYAEGCAGGAGGGALIWYIGGNLTLGADSVITADGSAGSTGTSDAGGGGGGGGSIIIIVAGSITDGGVELTATGGAGGNDQADGGAGAAGKVIIYSLSTGTLIQS